MAIDLPSVPPENHVNSKIFQPSSHPSQAYKYNEWFLKIFKFQELFSIGRVEHKPTAEVEVPKKKKDFKRLVKKLQSYDRALITAAGVT